MPERPVSRKPGRAVELDGSRSGPVSLIGPLLTERVDRGRATPANPGNAGHRAGFLGGALPRGHVARGRDAAAGRPILPYADGMRIAYAVHGRGPPLVIGSCWLSHLQPAWQSPVWRHFLVDLGRVATMIRYASVAAGSRTGTSPFRARSPGLDLEAVVAACQVRPVRNDGDVAGWPRRRRGPAARHPRRLTRLILYGTYGWAGDYTDPQAVELEHTFER